MGFEKLNFEKITENNETVFKINNKFVTEEVYNSTLNDQELYIPPPLPKIKGSPENNYENNEIDSKICQCDYCKELLSLIYEFRELDDYDALEIFKDYIEAIKIKTHYESLAQVYNELGNSMIKVAGKFESQLEEFAEQIEEYEE